MPPPMVSGVFGHGQNRKQPLPCDAMKRCVNSFVDKFWQAAAGAATTQQPTGKDEGSIHLRRCDQLNEPFDRPFFGAGFPGRWLLGARGISVALEQHGSPPVRSAQCSDLGCLGAERKFRQRPKPSNVRWMLGVLFCEESFLVI